MTDELFREDAALDTCDARITLLGEAGIELDRAVFYPQGGGGQAGDRGEMRMADGRVLVIADTKKGATDGAIVYLPAPGQEALLATLSVDMPVRAAIDRTRRRRHMRFHTATHLLCALVPYPVNGCSITMDYARLVFHMTEPLDKAALNAGLARLVAEAHPVSHQWTSDSELDANLGLVRSMTVQPPRDQGRVRIFGIGSVDLQPCGGTHVANTADIRRIVVTKIEKKSATTRRVVLGLLD